MIELQTLFYARLKSLIREFHNPKYITSNDLVGMYVVFAVLPNLIVFCFASLLDIDGEPSTPEFWRTVSSIFLSPWLETIIFFMPLVWMFKNLPSKFHALLAVIIAIIFAVCHHIFGNRAAWTVFMPLWLGVVMVFATRVTAILGKPTLFLVSSIHAIYNAIVLFLIYAVYFLQNLKISFELRWFLMAVGESLIIYLIILYLRQISIRRKID